MFEDESTALIGIYYVEKKKSSKIVDVSRTLIFFDNLPSNVFIYINYYPYYEQTKQYSIS